MTAALVDDKGPIRRATLKASSAVTAEGTVTETEVTGLGGYRQAQILLDVTAAAAASGDTLDVYVDTSLDGGTTWVNVVHFTQVLGNGGAKKYLATLDASTPGTSVVDVSSNASAGVVRPQALGDQLRARHTVVDGGAHGQSFTFSVKALLKK